MSGYGETMHVLSLRTFNMTPLSDNVMRKKIICVHYKKEEKKSIRSHEEIQYAGILTV